VGLDGKDETRQTVSWLVRFIIYWWRRTQIPKALFTLSQHDRCNLNRLMRQGKCLGWENIQIWAIVSIVCKEKHKANEWKFAIWDEIWRTLKSNMIPGRNSSAKWLGSVNNVGDKVLGSATTHSKLKDAIVECVNKCHLKQQTWQLGQLSPNCGKGDRFRTFCVSESLFRDYVWAAIDYDRCLLNNLPQLRQSPVAGWRHQVCNRKSSSFKILEKKGMLRILAQQHSNSLRKIL
jgi:hypothetical protein